MAISTKPASGFRDFLPEEMRRRDYVFGIVEKVFKTYGFDKIDTPSVERLSTLLGKYGEEGDQLLFRILNRGDKLNRALDNDPNEGNLAETGLRYDLTVPLARVFAKYRNDLPPIFKRYQIAPVWRADRPQRGRYREFYQCDVDIVGSDSRIVEVEVVSALSEILQTLKFENFRVHLNHRELLKVMIESAGIPLDQETTTLVALDKLDKVGIDGVKKELLNRGLNDEQIEKLIGLSENLPDDNREKVNTLVERTSNIERSKTVGDELLLILDLAENTVAGETLFFDPFLARGLSYYTGAIFEIRSDDFSGSLGGGGRYDELIGMFMKESVPACGFSLGLERIILLLEERGADFGPDTGPEVLVSVFSDELAGESLKVAHQIRALGKKVDVYPGSGKFKKQFKYANVRNIQTVIVLAPDEIENGTVSIKNMETGEQTTLPRADFIEYFK